PIEADSAHQMARTSTTRKAMIGQAPTENRIMAGTLRPTTNSARTMRSPPRLSERLGVSVAANNGRAWVCVDILLPARSRAGSALPRDPLRRQYRTRFGAKRMPQSRPRRLSKANVEAIFGAFAATMPEPKTELDHTDPFTLLVAVVLSAQATDAGVNKATPALFKLADTPEKMVKLGPERIEDLIRTIGLFRNKAKNVYALSHKLVSDFGGKVPQ